MGKTQTTCSPQSPGCIPKHSETHNTRLVNTRGCYFLGFFFFFPLPRLQNSDISPEWFLQSSATALWHGKAPVTLLGCFVCAHSAMIPGSQKTTTLLCTARLEQGRPFILLSQPQQRSICFPPASPLPRGGTQSGAGTSSTSHCHPDPRPSSDR